LPEACIFFDPILKNYAKLQKVPLKPIMEAEAFGLSTHEWVELEP
jgi:hypothetical protein